MGLFSNMPMCELGEQKYTYRLWTNIHPQCYAHLLLVAKIKGLHGLHVQIVPISAPSPVFII